MTEVVGNSVIVSVVVIVVAIVVMIDVDGNRITSLWLNATVVFYVVLCGKSFEKGDMAL